MPRIHQAVGSCQMSHRKFVPRAASHQPARMQQALSVSVQCGGVSRAPIAGGMHFCTHLLVAQVMKPAAATTTSAGTTMSR